MNDRDWFRVERVGLIGPEDCFLCGGRWKFTGRPNRLEVHEIARGVFRKQAAKDRRYWLRLCSECHEAVGDYSRWPIARQLALKAVCDPAYYDLRATNEIRGRDEHAIEPSEVDRWVPTVTYVRAV